MLALLLAAGLGSCGSSEGAAPSRQADLGPAEHFRPFTAYYLGRSYRGMALSDNWRSDLEPYVRGEPLVFVYGRCAPVDDEGRCNFPLQIENWPLCKEYAGRYSGGPRPPIQRIRGVPAAAFYDYGHVFAKLHVYTGRTTVVILADSEDAAREVAEAMRPVNAKAPRGRRLPAPPRGFDPLRGDRCPRGG